MSKGRKPKAREVQIAEGRHLKNPKRYATEIPETSSDDPVMPEHLDDTAKQEWERVEVLFRAAGMWTSTYQATLELYCETYSNYRRALELVRVSGQALRTQQDDGSWEIKRNPYSVELHKYKEELLRQLSEMGMTPSSRSRVVVADGQSESADPILKMIV